MVREFKLINEKGQEFSMMDIENFCLLTEPSGLGYSYSREYKKLGHTFVETFGSIEQGQIPATVNFLNYDNYRNFVEFIEKSENLKIGYKIPFKDKQKEYYKDINLQMLTKTEIQTNGVISESIVLDCLTLWYEEDKIIYKIEPQENEIRWNFRWDSRFTDYSNRNLLYINSGHIEAPIYLEINGYIENPQIELYIEGQLYQTIQFNTTIQQYEKLLYDSRENRFLIGKQNTDGTKTDLYDLDIIDIYNDNVLRIPKNKSCEIKITADNDIQYALLLIYPQYKAV